MEHELKDILENLTEEEILELDQINLDCPMEDEQLERIKKASLKKAGIGTDRKRAWKRFLPLAACLVLAVLAAPLAKVVRDHNLPDYQVIHGDPHARDDAYKESAGEEAENTTAQDTPEADAAVQNENAVILSTYYGEHGYPGYLGGIYTDEDDALVVLLCEDTQDIRTEIESLAGTDEIRYGKADYSYVYLTSIMNGLYEQMQTGTMPYVIRAELDDRANRVNVYLISAGTKERRSVAALDSQGNGKALNLYLVEESDLPAEDDVLKEERRVSAVLQEKEVKAGDESITILLTNHSETELAYGEEPALERETDGRWESVKLKDNVGWHEIAHILEAGGSSKDTVYLRNVYEDITPGHYRYSKKMMGENGDFMARVEFDIK